MSVRDEKCVSTKKKNNWTAGRYISKKQKNVASGSFHCSLLHLECHSILISNLNLIRLFSTNRGKRDLEN